MEIDWIRPSSKAFIQTLLDRCQLDLFVGSVHHVHTIPIDYDRPNYERARHQSGGTDEGLFENYFDLQYDMLRALKPPVVGHFDLIRLKSDHLNTNLRHWDNVWKKVLRNLDFIISYGGIVEINSAALRKGLDEPYPQADVCKVGSQFPLVCQTCSSPPLKEFLAKRGQLTISDDSHGISHVGSNYAGLLAFIEKNNLSPITFFQKDLPTKDLRFPGVSTRTVSFTALRDHPAFK